MDRRAFLSAVLAVGPWGRPVLADGRLPVVVRSGDPDRDSVVTSLAVDSLAERIVSGGDDHVIRVWDSTSGSLLAQWRKHHGWIQDIRFAPAGDLVASTGSDGLLLVWEAQGDGRARVVAHQPHALRSLDFDPTGRYLAVSGATSDIAIYDTETWLEVSHLRRAMPRGDIRCVRFAPNGERFATCARCGQIHVWALSDPQAPVQVLGSVRDRSLCLAFSWDGSWLASGGDDRAIRVWNLERLDPSGAPTAVIPVGSMKVLSLAFVGRQRLAVGGSNNRIHVWDVTTGNMDLELVGHTGSVSALAFGARRLVSGSYDTTVRIWSDAMFEVDPPLMARVKVTGDRP